MNSPVWVAIGLLAVITSAFSEDCSCGLEQLNTRIINGQEAQRGRYPWLVSLLIKVGGDSYYSCGASIINDRYLLTAAHCVAFNPKPSDITAMVGAHTEDERIDVGRGRMKLQVESIKIHENYVDEGNKMDDDIALIKLAKNVTFDHLFSPICLASFSHFDNLSVCGWGRQNDRFTKKLKSSKVLHEVFVDEVNNSTCKDEHWGSRFQGEKQICAGTEAGTCQGDSGGALYTRADGRLYQVGVVSFGPPGCKVEGKVKPDVYERITAHLDWIERNTQDAKWCTGPLSPSFTKQNVAQMGKSFRSGGEGAYQPPTSGWNVPSYPGLPPSSLPGGSGMPVRVIRLPGGRVVVLRPGPNGPVVIPGGSSNRGRY